MNKLIFGGAEKQGVSLAHLLQKKGFEVDIVCLERTKESDYEGINVKTCPVEFLNWTVNPLNIWSNISSFISLRKTLRCYDVVISFSQLYGLAPFLFKNQLKILFLRIFHPNSLRFSRRLCLHFYDIVATNNIPQYSCLNAIGVKSLIINNIVQPHSVGNKTITELKKNKKFIIISNVSPRKNIEVAIKAFSILKEYGFSLAIIGHFEDQNYIQKIKDDIKSSGNIHFLGPLANKDLIPIYLDAEGLIHPSLREGCPNAILEAMALGKPVIASLTPENMALLNTTEYLFDSLSPEDLAEKVLLLDRRINKKPSDITKIMRFYRDKIDICFSENETELLVKEIMIQLARKQQADIESPSSWLI